MPALIEFTVPGPPVSHQCSNRTSVSNWKAKVLAAATAVWCGKTPLAGKLSCTIINFYEGSQPPCDDDNMVKPIRDALNKYVYADDKQITHSHTIQISINVDSNAMRRCSALLRHCVATLVGVST